MSLLSVHNLAKSYGTHQVLRDVSFTLLPNQRVGLVGDNGSGKTTLARILAGAETPDVGTRMVRRDARVGYLAQVPQLDPTLSAKATALAGLTEWSATRAEFEAVNAELAASGSAAAESLVAKQAELSHRFEHLGGWEQEHRVLSLLEHLTVPNVDAPVGSLSGGEQRRVALAQLLVSEPDLLILDEPTNHLDVENIEVLEDALGEYEGTVLIVSHDRAFLREVATRVWWFDGTQLRDFDGPFHEWEATVDRSRLAAR